MENDSHDFNSTGYLSQMSQRNNLLDTTDRSDYSSARGLVGNESARATGNYAFKLDIGASDQARKDLLDQELQDEEDAEFLKQDTGAWDVFRDAKKFEKRDEILERRKKR